MAIQQHPVPQDISNYRFRLIGDMTIKQFASLGISIILSVMVYSAPLPFFFKYPLSFIFLILGVGMAFVPIQGRTLDIWIIAFIKSIYSSTQYIWKHGQEVATLTSATPTTETTAPITPVVPVSTPTAEVVPPKIEVEEVVVPAPDIPTDLPVAEGELTPEPIVTKTSEPLPTPTPPVTDTNLPIPITPSTPNTLVGLTLNSEGKILDGVLIEIKNQNLTLRATKSNKLGQFLFARPLENGLYQLLAEKENFSFDVYSVELTGETVNPLKIQALK